MVEITHVERADGMTGCRWIPWLPLTTWNRGEMPVNHRNLEIKWHRRSYSRRKKTSEKPRKTKKTERVLLFRKQTYWRHRGIKFIWILSSVNFFYMLVPSDRDARLYILHGFLVSKETVVLRRWERWKQKFGFIKRVDKGWITAVKDLESWRFER